jgi:lipid II:glycine glycyltransferase (peptidoglycan interpeptide bridge formation enzyme)
MGSSVLVHLAAIRALQSLGVAAYDLGGARRQTEDARLAGIFRFKERFGGVFEDCLRWRIALTRVGRLPAGSTPAPDESGSR